ncbi:MAG TPA: alpha/beta hydrolase [Rubrivivax sp.]|nr:alpha/beta hydrolase [Rubrivivax sp.]
MRPQGAEGGAQQGTEAGTAGAGPIEHVDIDWAGQRVDIEHQWIHRDRFGAPLVIFLHEGLGSVRMWKDFPARLCDALGWRGLVYSRVGYGGSRLHTPEQAWGLDFMHRQAHEVLPALLDALGIDPDVQPPWLLGHSDGGSIALLYAARYPRRVAGLVVMAPHIVVEDLSVASISAARRAYLETDLRERLAKYHDDPDRAFWRWNDIWLHPPFREWSIEQEIETIRCPVLAIQGVDDEYGTMAQIRGIARRVPQTQLVELPDCTHSPHRDQPDAVIDEVRRFVGEPRQAGGPGAEV